MEKLPTKKCPGCDSILERIYHCEHGGTTSQYVAIGYICPICAEEMIVLDRGYRKQDGTGGITCPECHGKSIALIDESEEKLKCLSCTYIFDLTPIPPKKVPKTAHRPGHDSIYPD